MPDMICPECRDAFSMPDEELVSPDPGQVVMIRCDNCGTTRKSAVFVAAAVAERKRAAQAAADRVEEERVRMQRAAAAVAAAREERELAAKIAADNEARAMRRRERSDAVNAAIYGKRYGEMLGLRRSGVGLMILGTVLLAVGILGFFAAKMSGGRGADAAASQFGGVAEFGFWAAMIGEVFRALAAIWAATVRTARSAKPVEDVDLWE